MKIETFRHRNADAGLASRGPIVEGRFGDVAVRRTFLSLPGDRPATVMALDVGSQRAMQRRAIVGCPQTSITSASL
jgi:hypothetical protein